MSESSELVAIFKLEFYKKKKDWVITSKEDKKRKKLKEKRNILNMTYTLENNLAQTSSLNKAFLESGLDIPSDIEEPNLFPGDHKPPTSHFNHSDPGKYPDLNRTHKLELSKLSTNDNLSKASLALVTLRNIIKETENEHCSVDVHSHLYLSHNYLNLHGKGNQDCAKIDPNFPDKEIDVHGWPKTTAVWTNTTYKDSLNEDFNYSCNEGLTQVDGRVPQMHMVIETPRADNLTAPVLSDSMIRQQVFCDHHPENIVYRMPSENNNIYNSNLLRHHLERLRMEEVGVYRGDGDTDNSREGLSVCPACLSRDDYPLRPARLSDSLDSLDSDHFMRGACKAPHSSEVELRQRLVYSIPQENYGGPLYRPASYHEISHAARTTDRSSSLDESPTKDVGLTPRYRDRYLAGSFRDVTEFDKYSVGRGRGRLAGAVRPGVAWRV